MAKEFNPNGNFRRPITEAEWNAMTPNQRKAIYLRQFESLCKCGAATGHKSGMCPACRPKKSRKHIRPMADHEVLYGG